ncbi:MAG: hypothetical protein ACI9XK_002738 [Granulosicoccus sp.]
MAKSLQEQLRLAGLANQKQVVKARKAKNTKEKMQRKGAVVVDEAADLVKRHEVEKLAKDRALNDARNRAAEERAVQAQIQQMVELNAIADRGDVEFSYDHNGKIRNLFVTADIRKALVNGVLSIVGSNKSESIVPRKVAHKIAERDATWILLLNSKSDSGAELDDEYAGYEIPDDLMW